MSGGGAAVHRDDHSEVIDFTKPTMPSSSVLRQPLRAMPENRCASVGNAQPNSLQNEWVGTNHRSRKIHSGPGMGQRDPLRSC